MGASGLGALLVKEGFLTEQDRVTITKTCGQGSWAFAKCILSTGLLDEDELSAFFAERTKYVVAPKNLLDRLDTGIVEQIDRRMVSRLEVLPLEIDHHKITVAVADPLDKSTIKQLEFFTGLEVVSVIAPLSQIYEGLSRLNPDFKPRPTALSNFLRNHAGTAWVKQKIVEEGDVDVPTERRVRADVEDWTDEQVEDVTIDDEDELDGLESSGNLNDIDAGGFDEEMGNSDFDDIELEDSNSDLELTAGEDPDGELDAGDPIDDAGLDLDDPFDNFDDAPKASKAKATAAPSDDDLEGLESGGSSEDLWPDADDEAAKPAPKPVQRKTAAPPPAELPDDFGLDDEPDLDGGPKAGGFDDNLAAAASEDDSDDLGGLDDMMADAPKKKAKPAADEMDDLMADDASTDDLLADDEPKQKAKPAADEMDDLMADDASTDDLLADDEPKQKAKPAADEMDDLMADDASTDDLLADDEPKQKAKPAADEMDDLMADDASIDDLLAEPPGESDASGEDLLAPRESTRMAQKPDLNPSSDSGDDRDAAEFDADEETSASLRKALHEEGVTSEFTDPGFGDGKEDTRIDLHAAIDQNAEFGDGTEETQIKLHPRDEVTVMAEPAIDDDEKIEDLAMGFNDEEAIDEIEALPEFKEPAIGDLDSEAAELDDIPINEPAPPARAGGARLTLVANGSAASLTATAKANEALLRMSLCFDRASALEVAREYLPQISATGCLFEFGKTTEALATWRSGAQSAAGKGKPSLVLAKMAKEAKVGQWLQIPVKDELFGALQSISIYKMQKADGRTLLLAGDYPLGDETLREALTSFAEQLGAK